MEDRAQILVPRQTNGHDCGVYLCCMADLLERDQDILQICPPNIRQARQQLYQSMIHAVALPLIAQDAGVERPITEDPADRTAASRIRKTAAGQGTIAATDFTTPADAVSEEMHDTARKKILYS